MLVKDRMTPQPLVVSSDTPISEVLRMMVEHHIHDLPVVAGERLVGLLTREEILRSVPSSAASGAGVLSVLETQYVLSRISAGSLMIRDVVTTTEDEAVEDAARVMVDRGVSCLPVLRDGTLVGLITDRDLLATMTEMLGAHHPGVRLSVVVRNRAGEMARLATAIAGIGGNLGGIGTWEGELSPHNQGVVLHVENVPKQKLVSLIGGLPDVEIIDARER